MSEAKACILSVAGPELLDEEAVFLAQTNPWAIILMGRSIQSRGQVRRLVDSIWSALGRPCLVFTDQEGGRVRRMRPPEWPDFPAADVYAKLYRQSESIGKEAAWLGHRLMAYEMQSIGIHADCAPVLDLRHEGAHDIVGDRAFGTSAMQVVELAKEAMKGLKDGGVACVIKHMPGHGRAFVDSHEDLPVVTAKADELEQDIAPFTALNKASMAMTAHIAYDAFDKGVPATVSEKVIREVVRHRIGFEGLLMTDDIGMKALGGTLASRAKDAISAGCDVVLHCAGFEKEPAAILAQMREVASAVPRLSGKALERSIAAENSTLHRQNFDEKAGWKRFNELLDMAGKAYA